MPRSSSSSCVERSFAGRDARRSRRGRSTRASRSSSASTPPMRLSENGVPSSSSRGSGPPVTGAALILTHDVETPGHSVSPSTSPISRRNSASARAFNFGAWYDVDPGVLRELRSRGFEIGMHGISHDRSLFSSRPEFERQLPLLRDLAATSRRGRLSVTGDAPSLRTGSASCRSSTTARSPILTRTNRSRVDAAVSGHSLSATSSSSRIRCPRITRC